jgi:hypothetical protein
METATLSRPRGNTPWFTLLVDGVLVSASVAVPFLAPVAGIGLVVAGVAGHRRSANSPAEAYLYTLSVVLGVGLLVVAALLVLLIAPAHASGVSPAMTPVAVPT